MRTNLPFIQHRIAKNLAESGTDIVLTWREWPAGTTFDETTQSHVADDTHQPIPKTATIKAFVHFPNFAANQVKQFNEIETGDMILDVTPDADVDGKEGLVFSVGGLDYVTKPVSDRLAKAWDVIFMGAKFLRPILLRRKT